MYTKKQTKKFLIMKGWLTSLDEGKQGQAQKYFETRPELNNEDRRIIGMKIKKGFNSGMMELYLGDGKYQIIEWQLEVRAIK